jgi:hypothetical protein
VLYAIAALFVKLSLFILYLRLFQVNKTARNLIYGGIICCCLFYVAAISTSAALETPSPDKSNNLVAWMENNAKYEHPVE